MQPTILIFIICLALIVVILAIRRRQEELDKKSYSPEPEVPKAEDTELIEKQPRIKILVSIGLALLAAGGLAAYLIMRHQTGEPCCEEAAKDSFPIAIFVPIWFAAMIPILGAKKKKQALEPSQQKLIIISVILTILLVLGTIVFLVLNNQ